MGSSFIHLMRIDSNEFFNGCVIFHGVYVPQLPYPFVCWWASTLLPCPGYYKQCCDEHCAPPFFRRTLLLSTKSLCWYFLIHCVLWLSPPPWDGCGVHTWDEGQMAGYCQSASRTSSPALSRCSCECQVEIVASQSTDPALPNAYPSWPSRSLLIPVLHWKKVIFSFLAKSRETFISYLKPISNLIVYWIWTLKPIHFSF